MYIGSLPRRKSRRRRRRPRRPSKAHKNPATVVGRKNIFFLFPFFFVDPSSSFFFLVGLMLAGVQNRTEQQNKQIYNNYYYYNTVCDGYISEFPSLSYLLSSSHPSSPFLAQTIINWLSLTTGYTPFSMATLTHSTHSIVRNCARSVSQSTPVR